jgi:ABC-type branched-subunit amino acid transport system ATPase component
MRAPVVKISGVQKHYAGLRPWRIRSLEVGEGERVALGGFDATTAELFVNLVTGASLPDDGSIRVFGRSTADITDGDTWLSSLDRVDLKREGQREVLFERRAFEHHRARRDDPEAIE